ncbi:unnamed protein product [Ceutorhynchus assimilis]|uniref:DUF7869 domain-containing protein n=1 Tax=Ceutorhynchus assimilis TaxID=467358 RepID=A0A9N9MYX7_9CUCU|nr:unnamed protein product [Ceutorhynchus assimilis]
MEEEQTISDNNMGEKQYELDVNTQERTNSLDGNIEEKQYELDVNTQEIQNNSHIIVVEEETISETNMEENQYNLDNIEEIQNNSDVNMEDEKDIPDDDMEEEQNNNFDNFSEDSDDSIKDRDFVISESGKGSDSDISEIEITENEASEESSEKDNLPLTIIRERVLQKEIKHTLEEIVEKVSTKLNGDMYTKKGTLRKRKRQKHSFVKENCGEKCKKKCVQKISAQRQEVINREFWDMTEKERRAFILHKTSTTGVKRRSQPVTAEGSRRNKSVSYYLPDETGNNQQVCKKFILATTSIVPKQDNRGRKQKQNKFDETLIEQHVESFGPTISHYRREHAPLRKYLPSDITIRAMHKNFLHQHQVNISYELYRKVVARMNISFSNLGHEECFVCESFRIHCMSTGHQKNDNTEDCDVCTSFPKHRDGYRNARKEYKLDSFKKDGLYVSADLQKVIMLPRCEMFKEIIFMPRVIAFNETFVPIGKSQKKPFAVIWHEAISGRSKDDIISTFYNFLLSIRDVENVTIWLDNCAAQNKNWGLFSFLTYVINSNEINLKELNLKYFQSGHTFMSSDAFHHQVELALKKRKKFTIRRLTNLMLGLLLPH